LFTLLECFRVWGDDNIDFMSAEVELQRELIHT
jgi:hypothetical protein